MKDPKCNPNTKFELNIMSNELYSSYLLDNKFLYLVILTLTFDGMNPKVVTSNLFTCSYIPRFVSI